MERWIEVVGYEGLYQVSNLGRVRRRGLILKPVVAGTSKYLRVCVSKNGVVKTVSVHRIVAEAWLGPCPNGFEVLHGVAGKLDNSVSNLSYGTKSQNSIDRRRDDTACDKKVCRSDGVEFDSMTIAARITGVTVSHISKCCRGLRNTTGGYGWQYL